MNPTPNGVASRERSHSSLRLWPLIITVLQDMTPQLKVYRQTGLSNLLKMGRMKLGVRMCLSHCSIAVQRHRDHDDSYKRKHLTGPCFHSWA